MTNPIEVDLSIHNMPYGTHQTKWDFRHLLYAGAAAANRTKRQTLIENGAFGAPDMRRLPFVELLFQAITTRITRGDSVSTVNSQIDSLFVFYRWCDSSSLIVTPCSARAHFVEWVNHFIRTRRLKRSYPKLFCRVAIMLEHALGASHLRTAKLINQTMLARVADRGRGDSAKLRSAASKQNLEDTLEFGEVVFHLCRVLDVQKIRGAMPLRTQLLNGKECVITNGIRNALNAPERVAGKGLRCVPVSCSEDLVWARRPALNLRIEAELMFFIAQTGMNLSQARSMQRESYRWKSEDGDALAFRVFKGRRHGEAIFRCYSDYRDHLRRYLAWLDETGLAKVDERLFPLIQCGVIAAAHTPPTFVALRGLCAQIGIRCVRPQVIRKTRINWMLRRTGDPNLSATMAAHSKEVLLKVYEEPNHSRAAGEISRYHNATRTSSTPPGPGQCTDTSNTPAPHLNSPRHAPDPDCISPEGCLFCVHHRDVMSEDYCWRLATHRKLKTLELALYRPAASSHSHPAAAVCERINEKLNLICRDNDERKRWVEAANSSVRAGRYHPMWLGHIELLESML